MKKRVLSLSIETKILIPFLFLVIVPILAVGFMSYWTAFQNYAKQKEVDAQSNINRAIAQMELSQQNVVQGLITLDKAKAEIVQSYYDLWLDELVIIEDNLALVVQVDKAHLLEKLRPQMIHPSGTVKWQAGAFHSTYLVYENYEPWNWKIGILVDLNAFSIPLAQIQKYTIIATVIASLFVIQATILLSHHFAKPLKSLSNLFHRLRDGQEVQLDSKLLGRNDEIGVLVEAFDQMMKAMEERKKMDAHLIRIDRLASLGELAAGMAHEIRNPLQGMKTSIQVLQKRLNPDGDNLLLLDSINREIERLNRLTVDLVHFAKPHTAHYQETDIEKVIQESLALVHKPIQEKGVNVTVDNKLTSIPYDSDHLKQILINLLLNAVKAVPAKAGQIHIRAYSLREEYIMELEDNGAGIPQELLDKIFNPFFTTNPQGSGLGLSVVHRLVSEHGGKIDVSSQEGKKTIFRFTIPKRREET